jgi:hypothetical protein
MPEKTTQIYYTDNGIQRFWNVTHQGEYLLNPIMVARFEYLFQQTIATMTSVSYYWSYHFDLNINQVALDLNGPHASPKFGYFETTPLSNTRNNIAKIMIAFDYMISPQGGSENTLEFKQFSSIAQLDNELEFKIQVNVKMFNDPNPGTIYYTKDYDFTEFEYAEQSVENIPYQLGRFYIKEMWLPTDLYPAINNLKSTPEYYNYVEFRLVPRGSPFAPVLVGAQTNDFFAGQHSIRIYAVNFFEYEPNVTNYTSYNTYTNTSITDVFPPNYDPNIWYKFVAELDLANKSFDYYINNVRSTFSFDTEIVNIEHSSIGFPNTDPDLVFYYTAPYTYVNAGYNGLVRDNDILIYGNDPSQGEMHFSHFNSKFSQTGISGLMVDAERNKLDNLINYNYYYETVKIPRYLNVKEFYADVLDARKILVNGNFAYEELTPSDQLLSLRSDDVSTDNVAISTAFVNIDKLFATNQNISGSLDYNHLTKTFEIIPFTNFDPLLYYDKTNTDLLFTSKVQFNDHFTPFNIFNSTFTRFELIDTEIELVDNDISYIYQHRERDTPGDISNQIVTYFFNCISNNTNLFLYRDLITNVMPPLIGSSTNITPLYAFDFNNNYLNSSKATGGSTFNLIDTTQISVVYGSSSTNQKLVSGLAGGVSILQHNYNTIFNYNNTFSLFHRPIQLVSHGIIVYRNASNVDTFNIAGVVQTVDGVNVFNYLLYIPDPNGGAPNVILFSNPNNDTFLNNDNAIVLYNFGNVYHWYINGAYHGIITLSNFTPSTTIETSKLYLDLSTIDSNCVIYDFKYFNTILFEEIPNTPEKILFNKKRLIDITQFTRINLLDDGTFILKELTPYKTIKANSLKSSSVVQYKPVTTLSSRRTVNVVEETSLKDISETEKYQVFDTEVEVNGNIFLENVNQDVGCFYSIYTSSDKQTTAGVDNFKDRASIVLNDSTYEWIFKREAEVENIQTATTKFIHDTTTLLTLKYNQVETNVELKVGTIKFADNTTLTTATTGFSGNYNDLTNLPVLFDGQYSSLTGAPTLANVATSGSYNDLINTPTQYTDADARSACFPLTQVNTGLPGTGAINLFDNNLWYNSTDGYNRLYFNNAGSTFTRAPNTTNSYVYTQIGTNTILKCGIDKTISYKNLHIGDGTSTKPTLFLDGANSQLVSSQIVFGDAGTSTAFGTYKQGMVIFYDSLYNYLRISADNNSDSVVDTPYFLNIKKSDGSVGIGVNLPFYKLDVAGDIHTNTTIRTPKIDFDDGTSMNSGTINYNDLTNTPTLFDGQYSSLTGAPTLANVATSGNYNDLINTPTQYTDADARSACFPLTQVNTGLPGTGAINLFDNDLWFNSTDANNRLYFSTNNYTKINAPIESYVSLQVGNNDILQCFDDRTISSKDLYINSGTNTTPTLFLNGDNAKSVSSQIIFGDSPASTGQYKQGMIIFYDSLANYLRISADGNNDNIIDTPYAFNISRSYGNVGIAINNPSYKLDVAGDIHTNTTIRTPRIDFNDGSSMTSGIINYNNLINTPTLFDGQYSSLTGTPTLANVATSGSYNDLTNTPTLFDGQYSSLTGTPTLANVATSGNYNDLTNTPTLFDGQYSSLTGTPTLANVATSGNYNDLTNTPTLFDGQYSSLTGTPTLANVATSGSYNDLTNTPFTPSYFKVNLLTGSSGRLSTNYEPGDQGSFFNTSSVPLNVGSYSVAIDAITIPSDGVYEVSYNMLVQATFNGGDRKVQPVYIRVNNTDPDSVKQAISSTYLRFRNGANTPNSGGHGGSTILQLNQNDLISIWSYREGSSGNVEIETGHLTIKRIA